MPIPPIAFGELAPCAHRGRKSQSVHAAYLYCCIAVCMPHICIAGTIKHIWHEGEHMLPVRWLEDGEGANRTELTGIMEAICPFGMQQMLHTINVLR